MLLKKLNNAFTQIQLWKSANFEDLRHLKEPKRILENYGIGNFQKGFITIAL